VEILQQSYRLLVEDAGFDPTTSSSIRTSSPSHRSGEHANYAVNFIEATRILKKTCPGAKVSGGVSTCRLRFAGTTGAGGHSPAFLYHAIRAGMDMGIVNAAS